MCYREIFFDWKVVTNFIKISISIILNNFLYIRFFGIHKISIWRLVVIPSPVLSAIPRIVLSGGRDGLAGVWIYIFNYLLDLYAP